METNFTELLDDSLTEELWMGHEDKFLAKQGIFN